jgi:hypothetical protein
LLAIVTGRVPPAIGTGVGLEFPREQLHLFDGRSGTRLS